MSVVNKFSALNRRKKWNIFLKEIKPTSETNILDVGFAEKEYTSIDNYIEKHYPYLEKLTALGINVPNEFKKRYPLVSVILYDGGRFPFEDQSFDVCWSNAVIEHVGSWDKQLLFVKEIKRVSKKAFMTTPNRFFPVEVHTRVPLLHYLPKDFFNKYLMMIGKKWATNDYMHLLSLSILKKLLNDAGISKYSIYKNRFLGFTLDFIVIF